MKIFLNNLKKPWPYWVGGILLGFINVILLILIRKPWRVTSGFSNDINQYTILNIGIILGSLMATLLASQFKIKGIKNKGQIIKALIGGVLMGYGAKMAGGCNIGTFFSGIPSFSLHAWIFGLFNFLGVGIGVKLIIKYIQ